MHSLDKSGSCKYFSLRSDAVRCIYDDLQSDGSPNVLIGKSNRELGLLRGVYMYLFDPAATSHAIKAVNVDRCTCQSLINCEMFNPLRMLSFRDFL